ncbi:hypothetical protein STXM2123_321 [Streptomyces sp. F-3]|nr:hypothetical protein STXM2123_321 [Streptomyces sp. F-3]
MRSMHSMHERDHERWRTEARRGARGLPRRRETAGQGV